MRTPAAPQSRDRLYLAYWHRSLGRDPDWDKWLRPAAWCPSCRQAVLALQVFKKPGADMGRYGIGPGGSYVYRCPRTSCRGQIVEPAAPPASTAIDFTLPTRRIADGRPDGTPYAEATVNRIKAGMQRWWTPLIPATMPQEKVAGFGEQAPMGRPAHPDEIAPSYVFLAADRLSSYYTGEILAPVGARRCPADPADQGCEGAGPASGTRNAISSS